jgi:hypothetical protein
MSFLQTLGGLTRRAGADRVSELAVYSWRRVVADARNWRQAIRTPVLEPYRRTASLKAYGLGALALLALAVVCIAYGFMFGLTAPYFLVLFVAPIAALCVVVVWALPDLRAAPTRAVESLFVISFIAQLLWPQYIALSLGSLPWITLQRLINLPLAGLLLICLSVSAPFRKELAQTCRKTKLVWILLAVFIFEQFVTLPLSKTLASSIQGVVLFQVNFTAMFVIATMVFRDARYVERFLGLLCAIAVPLYAVAMFESSRRNIVWAHHVPSFLLPHDPVIERVLTPSFRLYVNRYRAKAVFFTPNAFAEYISLLTPFLLHFALTPRKWPLRAAAAAMVPLTFYVVQLTDARIGIVGMLVSVLLYALLRSIMHWRRQPQSLLASTIVYAVPVVLCLAVVAIMSSHRMHNMVLGGGAQASSTEARNAQLQIALPKVFANPLGYGPGQCGVQMGAGVADGSDVTIDNYFIVIALDLGIPGIVGFYGMFITAIIWCVSYALSPRFVHRAEAAWLAPLGVCLAAFLVVKWAHGQDYNHEVYYSLLGMVVALVYKLRTSADGTADAAAPGALDPAAPSGAVAVARRRAGLPAAVSARWRN